MEEEWKDPKVLKPEGESVFPLIHPRTRRTENVWIDSTVGAQLLVGTDGTGDWGSVGGVSEMEHSSGEGSDEVEAGGQQSLCEFLIIFIVILLVFRIPLPLLSFGGRGVFC